MPEKWLSTHFHTHHEKLYVWRISVIYYQFEYKFRLGYQNILFIIRVYFPIVKFAIPQTILQIRINIRSAILILLLSCLYSPLFFWCHSGKTRVKFQYVIASGVSVIPAAITGRWLAGPPASCRGWRGGGARELYMYGSRAERSRDVDVTHRLEDPAGLHRIAPVDASRAECSPWASSWSACCSSSAACRSSGWRRVARAPCRIRRTPSATPTSVSDGSRPLSIFLNFFFSFISYTAVLLFKTVRMIRSKCCASELTCDQFTRCASFGDGHPTPPPPLWLLENFSKYNKMWISSVTYSFF